MKTTFFLILFFIGGYAFSQDIVLGQDVKSDTVIPTKGPNLKHFTHPYFGFGFPFATDNASDYIKPGVSSVFDLGIRYKHRLNNTFAMGFGLSFNWNDFRIKQGTGKAVPDSTENEKESLLVNSLTPELYLRINAGRRGNFVGKYLDMGAYGSWNVKRAHETRNKNDDGEVVKVSVTKLNYMEKLSYGVIARIGVNRFALTARYRLSNLFTKESGLAELPRFSAGLEIGFFK